MNTNVKLLTKFQKDFDRYLKIYNSFLIEGNIADKQVLEVDDEMTICDIEYYFDNTYNEDYLIITYDSDKVEGRRFNIINTNKEELNSSDVEFYKDLFAIKEDVIEDESEENYMQTNSGVNQWNDGGYSDDYASSNSQNNNVNYNENVDNNEEDREEKLEDSLTLGHSNEGVSLDLSKIHYVLNNGRSIPVMFIFLNTSRFGLTPGSVNSIEEQRLYNAMFELSRNKSGGGKVIFLTNKSNDVPAWIENEEINLNVKKLTILKPDEELRTRIVTDYINEYDNRFCEEYKDFEEDIDKLRDIRKLVSLLGGYSVVKIEKFFEFLSIEDNEDIADLSFKEADKLLLKFNFGTNITNPWDSDDIFDSIANIKKDTQKVLVGQDDVLDNIQAILGQAVTGFNRIANPKSPRAVLFLAGPTGTGKTEVTKMISEKIFKSQDKMIRFDMSEFSQEHADQRLFGAPPGYIGYESGGELTNAVSQNPFSLILFDEIEKAHPRILDKFLQILSDGRLTDGQGRTVSFENTIIVMTSNAGITLRKRTVVQDGHEYQTIDQNLLNEFMTNNVDYTKASLDTLIRIEQGEDLSMENLPLKSESDYYEHLKRFVKCNLSYFFENELNRKEIYGRLYDSVVIYNYISEEAMKKIVAIQMKKIDKEALIHGLKVDTNSQGYENVKNFIIEKCNTNEVRGLGGRGIVKQVTGLYAIAISKKIIEMKQNIFDDRNLYIDVIDDNIVVDIQ